MKNKVLFWVFGIGVVLAIIFFGLNYLTMKKPIVFRIPSEAMHPTILKGEKIGIDRFAYLKDSPKRDDIVVFKDQEEKYQVKRIIGLPMETIEIRKGKVLVNGQEIPSSIYYYNAGNFGKDGQMVKVPADSYYLLGDNSAKSKDSRYFGFVQCADIQGKVIATKSEAGKMQFFK